MNNPIGDVQIEYKYADEPNDVWCDLGPGERMRADFKGVYRLKAGVYPVAAAPIGDVFAPKVGEMWFVRFPGAIALSRCEVIEARLLTVTLAVGGNYHKTTYKRSDIEFVEIDVGDLK